MDDPRRKHRQMKKSFFLWIFVLIFLTTYSFHGNQNTYLGFFSIKKIEIIGTKFSDKRLIVYVNEKMNDYILNTKKAVINKLIFKNWIWINLKIDTNLKSNEYRIFSKKRKKDVTSEV